MHCVQKPFPDIFCWILPLLSLFNIRDQRAIVFSVIRLMVVFIKNPRPKSHCIVCCSIYVVFIKYSRPNSHCIVCCLIYDETKEPLYCLLFDLRWDQRAIVLSVVWLTVRPKSHCIVCFFDLRWNQRAITLSVVWFTVKPKSHYIVCCLIYGLIMTLVSSNFSF